MRRAPQARRGGGVDDGPAAARAHGPDDGPQPQPHALHVDRHDAVEHVLGVLREGRDRALDAGVVEEGVDAAEALHRLARVAFVVGATRHVGGRGDGLAARLGDGAHGSGEVAGGQVHGDDAGALAGEAHGGGASDAPGGAGDDGDLALEALAHGVTSGAAAPPQCRAGATGRRGGAMLLVRVGV